jgi:RNA polymerase sigma factor (sigma-70 family)
MAGMSAKRLIRDGMVAHPVGLPDEDLLERFLGGEELEAQEAFRALIERHGPRVLGICRHVLAREHDAEDAYQATFLTLARRGSTIRNRQALAGWLHEVAHRVALRAHARERRRRFVERRAIMMAAPRDEPGDPHEIVSWNEL